MTSLDTKILVGSCFPHSGGTTMVDYVLANQDLPFIHQLSITLIQLADHALLSFSFKVNYTHLLPLLPQDPLIPQYYLMIGIRMPFLPAAASCFLSFPTYHSLSRSPPNLLIFC
jgi:hypothetical protein